MKQETERKQGNKKTENKQTEPKKRWYDADLPSLIEEDLENSLSHNARKWALDFSNPEHIGEYTWNEYCGLLLQNAGDYRVRCILAIDCCISLFSISVCRPAEEHSYWILHCSSCHSVGLLFPVCLAFVRCVCSFAKLREIPGNHDPIAPVVLDFSSLLVPVNN